jgi:hypothetical protein
MNPGHLRAAAFGAAAALPIAVGFVLTIGLADALVLVGSLGLFGGLLVLQTRVAILAMRQERGPLAPVAATTASVCFGAAVVFFVVLLVGKELGAFDVLNDVGPWDWGPHLALFLTESLVYGGVITGAIVIAVVAVVQRVARRRAPRF